MVEELEEREPKEVAHEKKRTRKRTTTMVVDGASIKRILLARREKELKKRGNGETIRRGEL